MFSPPLCLLLLLSHGSAFFLQRPVARPSYQPPGQRKALTLSADFFINNYRPNVIQDSYGPPIPNPVTPIDSYGPPMPNPRPPIDSYGPPVFPPPRPIIPLLPPPSLPVRPLPFNPLALLSSKLARLWAIKTGILGGIFSLNPFNRPRPPKPSYFPPEDSYEVQIDPPRPSYQPLLTTRRPLTSTTSSTSSTLFYNNINNIVQPGGRFPGEESFSPGALSCEGNISGGVRPTVRPQSLLDSYGAPITSGYEVGEHQVGGVIVVKDNNNNNYRDNYSNTVIGLKSPKLNDNTAGQTYFSYNNQRPKARLSVAH